MYFNLYYFCQFTSILCSQCNQLNQHLKGNNHWQQTTTTNKRTSKNITIFVFVFFFCSLPIHWQMLSLSFNLWMNFLMKVTSIISWLWKWHTFYTEIIFEYFLCVLILCLDGKSLINLSKQIPSIVRYNPAAKWNETFIR